MKSRILLATVAAVLTACGGGGGGGTAAPTTPVAPAPTVTLQASSNQLFLGDSVTATWSSTNSSSCSATEGFTGSLGLTGNQVVTPTAIGSVRITVSCTGAGGTVSATQTVTVADPLPAFNFEIKNKSADVSTLGYEKENKSITLGEYQYNTGVWGVNSANDYSYKMYGSSDLRKGTANMTVEWNVIPSTSIGVVSFSNLKYGKNPGSRTAGSTTKLPIKLDGMPSMPVTGNVKTVCLTVCQYQTTFDIFVMDKPDPATTDIGTEILINTEHSGDEGPPADAVAVIGGVSYKLYRNSFGSKWNTIVYYAPPNTPITKLNLDIRDFLMDAVNRGWVSNQHYLVSVEFGTEMAFGKGTTTVTNMKIN